MNIGLLEHFCNLIIYAFPLNAESPQKYFICELYFLSCKISLGIHINAELLNYFFKKV